ncbi:MAG: ATP-dependent protease [Proteobacteria bacterium]|jgi:lon-related putative ATP-dependent protease|nr:MAG: ATP-dependent protease [Pseudomonadota bacterium]
MFFKRAPQGNKSVPEEPKDAAAKTVPPLADPHEPLPTSELRRTVDPATLGFETTDDLEPITGLIGQDRALRAIQFGANMRSHDFNMFVLGPPASGKSTAVRMYLTKKAAEMPPPPDWVYVNNFEQHNRPRAIRLPAGRGRKLAEQMVAAIDELRTTLPAIFESEEYQARRRAIEEEFRSGQEEAFEELNRKAQAQNIAILRTPMGFAMAPVHEGRVVKPEVFNALPEDMRKNVQAKIEALQKELEAILEQVPKSDKLRRNRLSELNQEMAEGAVREALEDVRASFADVPEVLEYLDAAGKDLIRNVGLFIAQPEENELVKQTVDTTRDPRFRRYMVNVIVENGHAGAPVLEEINPTYANLVGRVEHIAQMGALVTDFLLIKPGALHKANGGFLLIDARKLLMSPFAWEALKRIIKAREIRIEQPLESMGLGLITQTLDPEPIPLDVKVVLFGDRELYYLLAAYDPDFRGLFKVQADFDDTIAWSEENNRAYARVIASIVKEHNLKPVDASGVARVIEEGARLADDREKLSIELGRISDLVREADYWSSEAGRAVTTRADVERAIHESIQRADRLRDRAQEIIGRDIVFIDTEGAKVGQINGLSVIQLGTFSFGRPSRITARVRMGQGRVIDIEREVKLGGPLHSKGVMILWGYLAGRYAEDVPLALAATLVFEQSYGGVDGDSASSTELYALLSALSEVPVKQGLAVTGSVNQRGEVQAIGGVNEKIEGFFDICKARGLTGEQGVLIPKSNVQHLMLREDVIEAVREGKFHIYAVSHVDEGMEILTGIKAGERGPDGEFPPGTINRLVEDKLRLFAERARAFGKSKSDSQGNGKSA